MPRIKELDDVIKVNKDLIYRWLNELEYAFTLGDYETAKGVAGYIRRRAVAIEDFVGDFECEIANRKTEHNIESIDENGIRVETLRRGCAMIDETLARRGTIVVNRLGNTELRSNGNTIGLAINIESLLSVLGKTKGKE